MGKAAVNKYKSGGNVTKKKVVPKRVKKVGYQFSEEKPHTELSAEGTLSKSAAIGNSSSAEQPGFAAFGPNKITRYLGKSILNPSVSGQVGIGYQDGSGIRVGAKISPEVERTVKISKEKKRDFTSGESQTVMSKPVLKKDFLSINPSIEAGLTATTNLSNINPKVTKYLTPELNLTHINKNKNRVGVYGKGVYADGSKPYYEAGVKAGFTQDQTDIDAKVGLNNDGPILNVTGKFPIGQGNTTPKKIPINLKNGGSVMKKKVLKKRKKYADGTPIDGVSLGLDAAKGISGSLIKDGKTANVVDNALSMAGTGATIGGPIGGLVGLGLGVGKGLLENSQIKRPTPVINAGKAAVNTPGLSMKEGGVVKGPGGPKDDKVKTSLPEGSFVTPAENSGKAKMLRKEVLGKSVKENKTKGNVPVNLSAGEHVFTPEEKEKLIKAGVNLSALAPNAKSDTSSFSEGTPDEGVKKKEFQKAQLREYLKNPNVRAYLNGILRGEADPESVMDGKNPKSTAYGPYQFLEGTRKEIMDKYGVDAYSDDFEEASLAAIALIKRAGGMKSVAKGEFDEADKRLNKQWTSLPGGAEKNSKTDSIIQARKDSLEGKASDDLYIPNEGALPTYKRKKPRPDETETSKLDQTSPVTKAAKNREPYIKGEYKKAYDQVKALAEKEGIEVDWKKLEVSDDSAVTNRRGYAEMYKALKDLKRADVMQNYDENYKYGELHKLKKKIEANYAENTKGLAGNAPPIDFSQEEFEGDNRNLTNRKPYDEKEALYAKTMLEDYANYKKLEKQFEAKKYYDNETKEFNKNHPAPKLVVPKSPIVDPDVTNPVNTHDDYEAPVEAMASQARSTIPAIPTTSPKQNLATNFNYKAPRTNPVEPPPNPSANLIDKIGGIGTLLALGQTAWGTIESFAEKAPKFEIDPMLVSRRDQAINDANAGIDPAFEASAKSAIELNRRSTNQAIANASGGDAGTMLNNMSSSAVNANRSVIDLLSQKEAIKAQKESRADQLTQAVSNEKGLAYKYKLTDYMQKQQAATGLIDAGLSNIFGNLRLKSEQDKTDERAKKYGGNVFTINIPESTVNPG